jgi:hypothetical protein
MVVGTRWIGAASGHGGHQIVLSGPADSVLERLITPELGEQDLRSQQLFELCQRPSLANSEAAGNLAERQGA